MTAVAATETVARENTVTRETTTGLPERVRDHMEEHFPEPAAAGDYLVARDYRDNTAVVVWRKGTDPHIPGGASAFLIYHWHISLTNAGFICTGRTDMEVFGRPDEQSPDGRARWIHVTGWDPQLVRESTSVGQEASRLRDRLGVVVPHMVRLDPASVPPLDNAAGQPMPVHALGFKRVGGRLYVTVEFEDSAEALGVDLPDWVLAIAKEHEGCGEGLCASDGGVR